MTDEKTTLRVLRHKVDRVLKESANRVEQTSKSNFAEYYLELGAVSAYRDVLDMIDEELGR